MIRKQSFVRPSLLPHLKIVNYAVNCMKCTKIVLEANKILNQTIIIYIQNKLVEGSSKKIKS